MTEENTTEENTTEEERSEATPADMPKQVDGQTDDAADELTTFSREYVEELRGEAAKYRTRAKHTEDVERRLHEALVRLDGRLQDATDLDFDPKRLAGDGGVEAAITALLESKPHLAKRVPTGDVGAGAKDIEAAPDLISIMRNM